MTSWESDFERRELLERAQRERFTVIGALETIDAAHARGVQLDETRRAPKVNEPRIWTLDDAKAVVAERALWRCEVCGCSLMFCPVGYSFHHRRLRGMGGSKRADTHAPQNLLLLCGSGTTGCHGFAHHNRAFASDHGTIISRSVDPLEQPVHMYRGGAHSVFLDELGNVLDSGAL